MAGQNSPERVGRAIAYFLKRLKHLNHPAGVITGVFEVVESEVIGLAFGVAAVFHQKTAPDHIAREPGEVRSRLPAENGARDRRDAGVQSRFLRSFDVLQPVAPADVTD